MSCLSNQNIGQHDTKSKTYTKRVNVALFYTTQPNNTSYRLGNQAIGKSIVDTLNAQAHNNIQGSSQHLTDQTKPIARYSDQANNKPNIKDRILTTSRPQRLFLHKVFNFYKPYKSKPELLQNSTSSSTHLLNFFEFPMKSSMQWMSLWSLRQNLKVT